MTIYVTVIATFPLTRPLTSDEETIEVRTLPTVMISAVASIDALPMLAVLLHMNVATSDVETVPMSAYIS